MLDVSRLLKSNKQLPATRFKIRNRAYLFTFRQTDFGITEVAKIIGLLTSIEKNDPFRLPLVIDLGEVNFADKLSYILLECLCYYSLQNKHRLVQVKYKPKANIASDGILVSPLRFLSSQNRDQYLVKFQLEVSMNHYRRLISVEEAKKDIYFLSALVADVSSFLIPYDATERYRNELAEVIGELVDNAIEHAEADCLVDIDISREFIKRTTGDPFWGVNVTIINLSDTLLGYRIKEKLQDDTILGERDLSLKKALEYHRLHWGNDYTEEDFYNVASFQDRISGRNEKTVTGGTGLTKLISSLEKESDTYNCYLLTGQRKLLFAHEFLEYNSDGWIGFNKEKDFLNVLPSATILGESPVFIQGTAYNLSFAMKKEG